MPHNEIQQWVDVGEGVKMLLTVMGISWIIAAAFFAVIVWATIGEDYDRS